jgi:hypothetical protein
VNLCERLLVMRFPNVVASASFSRAVNVTA